MPCHLYVRQMSQSFAFCLRISWNYRKTRRAVRFCSGKEVENSHISQNHAMQIEIIWSRNMTPNNKLPKPRATTLNIAGCYMLRPFAHPVVCCMLLCVVGCCCEKFETGQTLSYNNSQHCWAYNVEIVASVCT